MKVAGKVQANILFFLIITAGLACSGSFNVMNSPEKKAMPPPMGGECEYRRYKGTAFICSIDKKKDLKAVIPYEAYEVLFTYIPDEKPEESNQWVINRKFNLILTNSSSPCLKFLKKYKIDAGKNFECYLNVITKGTCTPFFFDFPRIDLSDYFEYNK